MENILRILIFADLELPRNLAKIRQRENFPFYGIHKKFGKQLQPLNPSILPSLFVQEYLRNPDRNTDNHMHL